MKRPKQPYFSIISFAIVMKAVSTLVEFLAEVSTNSMHRLYANYFAVS